jgi:acetoacetyl-CoA synthetase
MKKPLWVPGETRIKDANITDFTAKVNERFGKQFSSYDDLYQWSIENASDFWEFLWEYGQVKYSTPYHAVVQNMDEMLACKWFLGAELNFAENLLRYRDEHTALVLKEKDRTWSLLPMLNFMTKLLV